MCLILRELFVICDCLHTYEQSLDHRSYMFPTYFEKNMYSAIEII